MYHSYWKTIKKDSVGFSPENLSIIPFFDKDTRIYLDDAYDEDWEEKENPPTEDQLDNYAKTFDRCLNNISEIILEIKEMAYEHYKRIYAKYYEDENPPLILNNADDHFQYMKDLLYLRISDDDIIRILINYDLDEEHGLEIKIQHNKVVAIEGIAET